MKRIIVCIAMLNLIVPLMAMEQKNTEEDKNIVKYVDTKGREKVFIGDQVQLIRDQAALHQKKEKVSVKPPRLYNIRGFEGSGKKSFVKALASIMNAAYTALEATKFIEGITQPEFLFQEKVEGTTVTVFQNDNKESIKIIYLRHATKEVFEKFGKQRLLSAIKTACKKNNTLCFIGTDYNGEHNGTDTPDYHSTISLPSVLKKEYIKPLITFFIQTIQDKPADTTASINLFTLDPSACNNLFPDHQELKPYRQYHAALCLKESCHKTLIQLTTEYLQYMKENPNAHYNGQWHIIKYEELRRILIPYYSKNYEGKSI